jgi:glycerol transport system permease protein
MTERAARFPSIFGKAAKGRSIPLALTSYLLFVLVPIYWLLIMSLKSQAEITSGLTLYPHEPTIENYLYIATDPDWRDGYINAIIYVILNVTLSLLVAIPAAYGFSRYRFLGDKHMFFWFLAMRMTPSAVLFLPLVQLYSNLGLMDTHIGVALAHCLFTVPVAIWILEGFMSGIPRELDQMAKIDGYGFVGFFRKIMLPAIAPGIGVAAFFCFMASWVELILANALTTTNAKPIAAVLFRAGGPLGFIHFPLVAAASVLTIIPGVVLIFFVRDHFAKGLSMGRVQ